MEQLKNFMEKIMQMQLINSIVVIVISLVLYEFIAHFFNNKEKNSNLKMFKSKKGKTYYRLIKSIIRYVFIIITILILLQVNGVNVSSMLAGVGIISVVIGFAIQDALKDIIKGFDIISDSYYNVGDVIKYNGLEGKVISIGIKTTKVEELKTSNIVSISNRNIEQVEVVSNFIFLDVPMPYEVSLEKAEKAISDIINLINNDELIYSCEYRGVNELADSSVNYQLKIECMPIEKLQARRNSLRCILQGLEKNKIDVPYKQIDVHQK
ncbi:MAG: mechanosensitive ion channel family protein [Clostridia bacterium]|nr:mechanosensitive ion channel family protein [Clostridia bacterium]